MIDRRWFISSFAGGLLAKPLVVEAQQAGRVFRIGYLSVPSRESQDTSTAFERGLHDLGWIEGRNIVVDARFADGNLERLPELAAELVRLGPDVIVAPTTPGGIAAKNATRTIPIVMVLALDPVETGLVDSLARPGGNVTGLTIATGREIYGKQLQLLKDAFPRVSRVAILLNRAGPTYARALREVETVTRALGLQQRIIEIRDSREFDNAFAAITTARADAIFVPSNALFYQHRARLAQLAAKTRLPAMWGLREHAEAGGLMAYRSDLNELARRAAIYVDKILKGAKPADLPVEQPTKFELVINLKTAKALGLTIPRSILVRADHIIQ